MSRAVRSFCPYSRLNSRFFGARSSVGREADIVEDGVIDCGQHRILRNRDRITFHIHGRVLNERGLPIHPASLGYHTARAYFQGGRVPSGPVWPVLRDSKKRKAPDTKNTLGAQGLFGYGSFREQTREGRTRIIFPHGKEMHESLSSSAVYAV